MTTTTPLDPLTTTERQRAAIAKYQADLEDAANRLLECMNRYDDDSLKKRSLPEWLLRERLLNEQLDRCVREVTCTAVCLAAARAGILTEQQP